MTTTQDIRPSWATGTEDYEAHDVRYVEHTRALEVGQFRLTVRHKFIDGGDYGVDVSVCWDSVALDGATPEEFYVNLADIPELIEALRAAAEVAK